MDRREELLGRLVRLVDRHRSSLREPPVLEHAAAGLALGAVVDRVLLEVDPGRAGCDSASTARRAGRGRGRWRRSPAPCEPELEPAGELVTDRGREPLGLLLGELGRERVGRERGPYAGSRSPRRARCRRSPAGRAGASAAGASRRRGSARASRPSGRRPRGRDDASSAASASGRSSQTPARFRLPASVSTSSPPSSKRRRKTGVFGPCSPGREIADPPGAHQVNHQRQLAVLGRKEQSLCPSVGARDPLAGERRERRIERLQRCDMRGAGLRDRAAPRPRGRGPAARLRLPAVPAFPQRNGAPRRSGRRAGRPPRGWAVGH